MLMDQTARMQVKPGTKMALLILLLLFLQAASGHRPYLFTSTLPANLVGPSEQVSQDSTRTFMPRYETSTFSSETASTVDQAEIDTEATTASDKHIKVDMEIVENNDSEASISASKEPENDKIVQHKQYWRDHRPLGRDNSFIPPVVATCTIIGLLVIFLICLVGTHQIKSKQPTRRKKLMFHKKITVHIDSTTTSRYLMKSLERC